MYGARNTLKESMRTCMCIATAAEGPNHLDTGGVVVQSAVRQMGIGSFETTQGSEGSSPQHPRFIDARGTLP